MVAPATARDSHGKTARAAPAQTASRTRRAAECETPGRRVGQLRALRPPGVERASRREPAESPMLQAAPYCCLKVQCPLQYRGVELAPLVTARVRTIV